MSNLFTVTITFNNKDWFLSNEGYSGEEFYLPHVTTLPNLDLGPIKGGYYGVKLGSLGILNKPQDRFSPFSIYTNGYNNLLGNPNQLIPCKIYWGEKNMLIFDGGMFLKSIKVDSFDFQLRSKSYDVKTTALVNDTLEELAQVNVVEMTNSGNLVTVYAPSHRFTSDDLITVRDASPVGFNVENKIISVLDDNRFTYTESSLSGNTTSSNEKVFGYEKREVGFCFGDVKMKGPLVLIDQDEGDEFANPGFKWLPPVSPNTDSDEGYIDTANGDSHLGLYDEGLLVGTTDNQSTQANAVLIYISAATLVGNLLYVTTATSHNFLQGQVIQLMNFATGEYNVITIVQSVPQSNQFTCHMLSTVQPSVQANQNPQTASTKVKQIATYFGANRLPNEARIQSRESSSGSTTGVMTLGEVYATGTSVHGKTIYEFFEYLSAQLGLTNVDFSKAPNSASSELQLWTDKEEPLLDYAGKIAEGCDHVFRIDNDTLYLYDLGYTPSTFFTLQNREIIAMEIKMAKPVKSVMTEFVVNVPLTNELPTSVEEQKRYVRVDNLVEGKDIKIESVTDNISSQKTFLTKILQRIRKPIVTVQVGGVRTDINVGSRLKFARDEHHADVDMMVRNIKYDFNQQFTSFSGDATVSVISSNELYG